MLTIKDIAWVAGLIEGEGYIGNHYDNEYPRIAIAMTDLDVLIRAAEILGATTVRTKKLCKGGVKPQFHVRIGGRLAIEWCMTIYPLMGERRQERIRELIDRWRNFRSTRKKRDQGFHVRGSSIVWQRLPKSLPLLMQG